MGTGLFYFGFMVMYSLVWYFRTYFMDSDDLMRMRRGISAYLSPTEANEKVDSATQPTVEKNETKDSNKSWWTTSTASSSNAAGDSNAEDGVNKWFKNDKQENDDNNNKEELKKMGRCRMMLKLGACLTIDMLGNSTYAVPAV